MPTKKPKSGELNEQQKQSNRNLSAIQAVIEHPLRIIKRQSGFTKVHYRGLKINTGQIVTLFVLSNRWMARHRSCLS
ncbi:MAG: transposase [Azonexus sp.]|nr:transposase [Azonexus sp.]